MSGFGWAEAKKIADGAGNLGNSFVKIAESVGKIADAAHLAAFSYVEHVRKMPDKSAQRYEVVLNLNAERNVSMSSEDLMRKLNQAFDNLDRPQDK